MATNPQDVVQGTFIAHALAYAMLVQALEANQVLSAGLVRDGLDRLIESREASGASEPELRALNEIVRSLPQRPR